MKLKNKKAIVIGGSKGIGNEIQKSLKSLKIKTIGCSRKDIDTSSIASVKKSYLKHNSVDILILNSGGPPPLKLGKIKISDWNKYFKI